MVPFFSILLFSASILAFPQGDPGDSPAAQAANISLLTSFFGYDGCNTDKGNQKDQIIQAQQDAVTLATSVVGYLSSDTFNTDVAAIDYFGPPDETEGIRDSVIKQLQGAQQSYPHTFSDWWNDRYVKFQCASADDQECPGTAAYFRGKVNGDTYPTIVFCPGFFGSARPSLSSRMNDIKNNKVLQGYASALQTQATTLLHELFHVDFGTAQISNPPAKDQMLYVGPPGQPKTPIRAYKPGRAKLLALTKGATVRASQNNDCLTYFTAAKYMTRQFGVYPAKPRAWNPLLSVADNLHNDQIPAGPYAASAVDDLEGTDQLPDQDDSDGIDPAAAGLWPDSEYPPDYLSTYGSPTQGDNSTSSAAPTPESSQAAAPTPQPSPAQPAPPTCTPNVECTDGIPVRCKCAGCTCSDGSHKACNIDGNCV